VTSTTELRPTEADDGSGNGTTGSGRRRTVVVVVVAATVLVSVVVTWVVAFSSLFGVRTVQVHGEHVLSEKQVAAAADVAHGTPLVRIDTAAVTRRVERLPEVASAEVSTSFPSTLVIRVTERLPVGYVRRGSQAELVDATGDQYRTVASAPAGLPRFVVPAGTDARTTGGAVATVAAALPAALRHRVRSIEALDPAAITLVLTHGRVVAWGSAARSPDKARVLPALLAQKHATYVDVTNPDQPFTR
jgi:cell division protein FtsQ